MNDYYSIHTEQGKLVYELQYDRGLDNGGTYTCTKRAVQQADGSFWLYEHTVGGKKGNPQRGKSSQKIIHQFIEHVKKQFEE
jgi:hypothetical protein